MVLIENLKWEKCRIIQYYMWSSVSSSFVGFPLRVYSIQYFIPFFYYFEDNYHFFSSKRMFSNGAHDFSFE